MTAYSKWDVVLIPFPFSDLTASKRRPAIVISSPESVREQELTLLFVTSNVNSPTRKGDHQLSKWSEAGFPKPSMARMKFVTIHRSLLVKKFGRVDPVDRGPILANIVNFFSN